MASRRPRVAAPPERQNFPLHDELLEDIFLRLSSPVDLASVSAACFAFRQVIADEDFLRQYRAVHPPLLLGCLLPGEFHLVDASHRNAAAARALASAVNMSNFDYLPRRRKGWHYSDICEGRVLLEGHRKGNALPDLAVCDPCFRLYRLLPPISHDLLVSAQVWKPRSPSFRTFLVPSGHLEDTSFKVIARTYCAKRLTIFLFSSESNQWSVGASTSWSDLGFNSPAGFFILNWSQCDHSCFYWKVNSWNKLLKLDINRMELSCIDLSPDQTCTDVAVAEAGEGRLAIFSQMRFSNTMDYYTLIQNEGERANQWQMEKAFGCSCKCSIVGASAGYIFLIGYKEGLTTTNPTVYSLEIKTLKIEKLCSTTIIYGHLHPYFGYPPFLSPRRI